MRQQTCAQNRLTFSRVAEPSVPASSTPSHEGSLSSLRPSLQPHLRLFLSADIVGSTAFKQGSDEREWFAVVLRFYQLTEAELMRHWSLGQRGATKGNQLNSLYGEPPSLWKTIGDEVTFSKPLSHPAQAVTTLHAWIAALAEVRLLLRKHHLDVKASAWVADFPLRNREIVLRFGSSASAEVTPLDDDYFHWWNERLLQEYTEKKGAGLIKDFVGPSIDTGFRLSANASPRKLAISVELAYLLAGEDARSKDPIYNVGPFLLKPFLFRYDSMIPLKGVLSGAPYPAIWIDVLPNEPLHIAEDELAGVVAPTPLRVRKFADAYIRAHQAKLCSLYMHSDLVVPDEYSSISQANIQALLNRQKSYDAQDKALSNEAQQNEEPDVGSSSLPITNTAKSITELFTIFAENLKKAQP